MILEKTSLFGIAKTIDGESFGEDVDKLIQCGNIVNIDLIHLNTFMDEVVVDFYILGGTMFSWMSILWYFVFL